MAPNSFLWNLLTGRIWWKCFSGFRFCFWEREPFSGWAIYEHTCWRLPLAQSADFLLAPRTHKWHEIIYWYGSSRANFIGPNGSNLDKTKSHFVAFVTHKNGLVLQLFQHDKKSVLGQGLSRDPAIQECVHCAKIASQCSAVLGAFSSSGYCGHDLLC